MMSRLHNFLDWVLINYGWDADTLHDLTVQNHVFFHQGDIYRVADNPNTFIVVYIVDKTLICAKVNWIGQTVLWLQNVKYKCRRWKDGL